MNNSIFFTPDRTFSYNAILNFVIGQRGCGKTYGTKKWAIKRFLKTGEKFIYLRRYKDELKECDKFFATLQHDEDLKIHQFKVQGRRFFIDGQECGKADCLSTAQFKKGVEEPVTNLIIFDEFIVEKSYIKYLPNEVSQLLNYIDSVFRNRNNCRCICLANSISWVNPYFTFYKFVPMGEGFQVRQNGAVLLHVYNSKEFADERSKTRFAKLVSGTAYEQMALHNHFADVTDDFIRERSKQSTLVCNLVWKQETYGLWSNQDEGCFVVSHKHNPDAPTFCYTTKDYKPNMKLITDRIIRINKELKRAFLNGYLFYEDVYIRNEMYDLLTIMGIR